MVCVSELGAPPAVPPHQHTDLHFYACLPRSASCVLQPELREREKCEGATARAVPPCCVTYHYRCFASEKCTINSFKYSHSPLPAFSRWLYYQCDLSFHFQLNQEVTSAHITKVLQVSKTTVDKMVRCEKKRWPHISGHLWIHRRRSL